MGRLKLSFPTFRQPGTVVSGTGARKSLAGWPALSQTAFFLSGSPGVQELFREALGKQRDAVQDRQVCTKPSGEPTREMIRAGAEFLRRDRFRSIVGIGGGSVLDWCRLAWAEANGLLPERPHANVQINDPVPERPVFRLIPTTCATGAEGAAIAVFTDADGRKIPVVSPHFLADEVVLDGKFLESLEPGALANSLCDALSHAVESSLSLVPSPFAGDMAAAALQRIFDVYAQSDSSCRNDRLVEAAYLAGIAASNVSVGVVHAFAHTMAAYSVPHGHGNALGLLAGIRLNGDVPAMQALTRRCGLGDAHELGERIRPIVRAALTAEDRTWANRLRDDAFRQPLAEAMAGDFCLRTNPKRLDQEDLMSFLEGVAATIDEHAG